MARAVVLVVVSLLALANASTVVMLWEAAFDGSLCLFSIDPTTPSAGQFSPQMQLFLIRVLAVQKLSNFSLSTRTLGSVSDDKYFYQLDRLYRKNVTFLLVFQVLCVSLPRFLFSRCLFSPNFAGLRWQARSERDTGNGGGNQRPGQVQGQTGRRGAQGAAVDRREQRKNRSFDVFVSFFLWFVSPLIVAVAAAYPPQIGTSYPPRKVVVNEHTGEAFVVIQYMKAQFDWVLCVCVRGHI